MVVDQCIDASYTRTRTNREAAYWSLDTEYCVYNG